MWYLWYKYYEFIGAIMLGSIMHHYALYLCITMLLNKILNVTNQKSGWRWDEKPKKSEVSLKDVLYCVQGESISKYFCPNEWKSSRVE